MAKTAARAAAHENLDERLLHRLLFFTDAVFAIVLTILVLELRAPEGRLEATPEFLRETAPHVGAFVFSFIIIGVFWAVHMNTMRRLAVFDWPTALANLTFLLPICLLPWATAWMGADLRSGFPWEVYCWTLVAIAAANIVLVLTAYRGGGRLIAGGVAKGERLYRVARASAPGLSFAVGLVLVRVGQPVLAHFCWALIGPFFWLASRLRPKTT